MSEIDNAAPSGETTSLRDSIQAAYDAQVNAGDDAGSNEARETPAPRDDGRDDKGRFAPKEKSDDDPDDGKPDVRKSSAQADASPDVDSGDRTAGEGREAESSQAPASPPPGWSVASKAAWNELPAAVKADIAKREQEVSNGFKQYQGLGELKAYAEAFERQGVSIKQQFDGYLRMDRALQTDFAGGIRAICQHYGVDPAALAGVLGGQGAQQQPDPIRDALSPLQREIQSLRQEREADRRAAQEREHSESVARITAFASDPKHTYFENVRQTMGHLITTGQAGSMEDAYEKAIWMHPEIRPLLLKQQQAEAVSANQTAQRQAAATQARQSARSITGSPAPGGSSAARQSASRSIREIAEEAARAQGVSL